ncbi:MAG: thioredoxin family protein [Chthoniobacterales bacterium]
MRYFSNLGAAILLLALFATGCSRKMVDEQIPSPVAGSESLWLTNYARAQGDAKAKQKFLLLDFTGSDWCGWCIRLKREVFDTPEFEKYARENLILLEVDFPRAKELDPTQKTQNALLAQELGIQGFPTVVIMNSDGKVIGKLGYTPGGPSVFISALEKLRRG